MTGPCGFSSSLSGKAEKRVTSRQVCLHDVLVIKKPARIRSGRGMVRDRLLCAEDRVFGGFGNPELDNLLCLDLDGFTGCGVSAHAGLALYQHELAEPRQRESVLCFLIGHFCDEIQYLTGRLLGE